MFRREGECAKMGQMFASLFYYPKPLWRVWSLFAGLFGCISLGALGMWIVIADACGASRRTVSGWIYDWAIRFLNLAHIEVVVRGRENLVGEHPKLVTTNHQSLLDIPTSYIAMKDSGDMRMVSKKVLGHIPFFGWGMRSCEFILVDRSNQASREAAGLKIRDRILSGLQIWIAPEGTRSADGTLLDFKTGSFAFAIDAQVPVQPIVIFNAKDAMPKNSLFLRPGAKIYVQILPEVSTEGLKLEDRGMLMNKVRGQMLETLTTGPFVSKV
ncbi:MAG: 1-acyl-sn-glycerol-3-phosphate acyltransferase [Bdellovibrionales bacterium]|nr:1-acyl-sn-glycerol-3-phosphate acyltransferase [Bdellovibrionales bacterium]